MAGGPGINHASFENRRPKATVIAAMLVDQSGVPPSRSSITAWDTATIAVATPAIVVLILLLKTLGIVGSPPLFDYIRFAKNVRTSVLGDCSEAEAEGGSASTANSLALWS